METVRYISQILWVLSTVSNNKTVQAAMRPEVKVRKRHEPEEIFSSNLNKRFRRLSCLFFMPSVHFLLFLFSIRRITGTFNFLFSTFRDKEDVFRNSLIRCSFNLEKEKFDFITKKAST